MKQIKMTFLLFRGKKEKHQLHKKNTMFFFLHSTRIKTLHFTLPGSLRIIIFLLQLGSYFCILAIISICNDINS